jgi:hypothetical protein
MDEKNRTDQYVDFINSCILPFIDYSKLQASYDSDMVYAKGVLNRLHTAMVTIYGTDTLDGGDTGDGFVIIPGVVRGRDSEKMGLALLRLDLSSSGEHLATDFLCRYGVISQDLANVSRTNNNDDVLLSEAKEIVATYLPYDYCYTAVIPDDIHVGKTGLPEEIKAVLKDFRNCHAVLQFEHDAAGAWDSDAHSAAMPVSLPDPTGRGYVFAVADDSDFYIPGALHIERDDSMMTFKHDGDAADAAKRDGVPLIGDMDGVPDGVYIDTPKNRAVIAKCLAELLSEHWGAAPVAHAQTVGGTFADRERTLQKGGCALMPGGPGFPAAAPETPRPVAGADEKPSVVARIRRHAAARRERPVPPKETHGRKKSGPEL